MDNIGFYSRLGFVPGRLTLTMTLEAARPMDRRELHEPSRHRRRERRDGCLQTISWIACCRATTTRARSTLTHDLALGDTLLLYDGGRLIGFALAHTAPLVEGDAARRLRVLKLVLDDEQHFGGMALAIADFARRSGTRRVAFRIQGEYGDAFRQAVGHGAHIRWSDLRMSFDGYRERRPTTGMVLSNWEI